MPNTPRLLSEKTSPDTAGHIALITMWITTSPVGSQSEPLFTRAFYVDKGGQPGSYCLSRTMRTLWQGWRFPTSLLKITHYHCLHYWPVGDGIMPPRSNSSSRRDMSALYPGVDWRSDAIPQECLDGILNQPSYHFPLDQKYPYRPQGKLHIW
jgi:hypothetical protein